MFIFHFLVNDIILNQFEFITIKFLLNIEFKGTNSVLLSFYSLFLALECLSHSHSFVFQFLFSCIPPFFLFFHFFSQLVHLFLYLFLVLKCLSHSHSFAFQFLFSFMPPFLFFFHFFFQLDYLIW